MYVEHRHCDPSRVINPCLSDPSVACLGLTFACSVVNRVVFFVCYSVNIACIVQLLNHGRVSGLGKAVGPVSVSVVSITYKVG